MAAAVNQFFFFFFLLTMSSNVHPCAARINNTGLRTKLIAAGENIVGTYLLTSVADACITDHACVYVQTHVRLFVAIAKMSRREHVKVQIIALFTRHFEYVWIILRCFA